MINYVISIFVSYVLRRPLILVTGYLLSFNKRNRCPIQAYKDICIICIESNKSVLKQTLLMCAPGLAFTSIYFFQNLESFVRHIKSFLLISPFSSASSTNSERSDSSNYKQLYYIAYYTPQQHLPRLHLPLRYS